MSEAVFTAPGTALTDEDQAIALGVPVQSTLDPGESDFSPRKIKVSTAIALGTMFGSTVLPFTAQAQLLLPMTGEFHWSRTAFSLGLSAMMLGGMISAPILGRLIDKVGVRPVLISGTVVVGLLTMLLAFQRGTMAEYLVGYAVLGGVGSTAMGYQKVLGSLFNKHRGKAMAILGIESSLSMAVVLPIITWLLTTYGWRGCYVGMGCIILAMVPIQLIWLSEPDQPLVAMAEGGPAHGQVAGQVANQVAGMSTGEALRDRTFWMITLAGFAAIIPAMGLMQHMIPYLMSKGFGLETAAWRLTVMSVAMAVGTVAGGWMLDKSDSPKIGVPFAVLATLAQLGLLYLSPTAFGSALLVGSMVLMGFAGGAKRPMATFFQLRFFGLRDFAGIVGVQSPITAFGMLIAPPLTGYCYDRWHTYTPALWAMVALMAVTIAMYMSLGRYRYGRDLQPVAPTG